MLEVTISIIQKIGDEQGVQNNRKSMVTVLSAHNTKSICKITNSLEYPLQVREGREAFSTGNKLLYHMHTRASFTDMYQPHKASYITGGLAHVRQ